MKQEVGYHCIICQKNRYVKIDPRLHLEKISISPNGLSEISDIHYCFGGMLSINNLHVDKHFSVRSFSMIELPDSRRQSLRLSGIPLPKQQIALNTYKIDKMVDDGGYRLRLVDHRLRINLNIGEVASNEEELERFTSIDGHVDLFYYECGIPLRKFNRAWMKELINTLEILPPTTIGLFLESIRFVYQHNNETPDNFRLRQLRTLLTAHNTTIKILPHNYRALKNITNKYGKEKRVTIDAIIQILEENTTLTLREIKEKLKEDLVYLIFLMLMLEIENVISISRDDRVSEY